MHTFFIARGIQQEIELWKMFMQTQMFLFPQTPFLKDDKGNFIKNEDGTYKKGVPQLKVVQGALRPIQIYEYVHPKESLPEVLCMLGATSEDAAINPKLKPMAWVLRKMLGAQPLKYPDVFGGKKLEEIPRRYSKGEAIAISVIGIKDDITGDFIFGNDGFYQEGL